MHLHVYSCSHVIMNHICNFNNNFGLLGQFIFLFLQLVCSQGEKLLLLLCGMRTRAVSKSSAFLVLFCHPVATGENREKSPKRFCLERLIMSHPASKSHDCILGDSQPSAWKAKNKPLLTLFSSHSSVFPSLYVFVSGMTADTPLKTKTINFLAGAK